MTTYYVRKDGDDTTGDGSTGSPWLTIAKAQTAIIAAGGGGHILNIGAGTYAEDNGSGLLTLSWNVSASGLIFQSESGNAEDVIITGASSATYNVIASGNSRYLTFRNLTFGCRVATNSSAIRLTACHHCTFDSVKFQMPNSGAAAAAVLLIPSGAADNINTIAFLNCQAVAGVASGKGWIIDRLTVGRTVDTITLTNCSCSSSTSPVPLTVKMATNVTITGGTFVGDTYGILFGVDGTGETVIATGTVTGVSIGSESHSLLIGNGTSAVQVSNNIIAAGIYGIVVKESDGHIITNNTINVSRPDLADPRGILFKAATNVTVTRNRINNSSGVSSNAGMLMTSAGDTGNKVQNITFTNNIILAGRGFLDNIVDDSGDLGGCVIDYNQYQVTGTGWGIVRGASIQNLAELRAAWAGYGDGSNDSHSSIYSEGMDAALLWYILRRR